MSFMLLLHVLAVIFSHPLGSPAVFSFVLYNVDDFMVDVAFPSSFDQFHCNNYITLSHAGLGTDIAFTFVVTH
jgi:hypothetical protein